MQSLTCARCATPLEISATVCAQCGLPAKQGGTASLPAVGMGVESSVREIAAGDVLAETYRVIKKIGEGGMGTVLLARDDRLDRDVAVKVLARQMCEDGNAVARFEREAKITARLDHSNIVPVYAVGRFHERPFMVMKFLEGLPLSVMLQRRPGPWPWADVRPIVEPLCLGLSYLHRQGLVHRDVKPGNVFVGPTGHVTLLDFGVLKEAAQDLTGTGQMLGTLRFMAPEQMTASSEVDARADVYALGVMLYRLLAGATPFKGDDLAVAQRKLVEDPPSATTLNGALPAQVAAVLQKAVSREREARFADAEALMKALDEAYAGNFKGAPRAKKRWPLAFAAVLPLGLLAVGGWRVAHTAPEPVAPLAVPAPVVAKPVEPVPKPVAVVEEPPVAPVPSPVAKSGPRKGSRPKPVAEGTVKVSFVSMVDGKSSYAELSVDGVSRGETPTQLELSAGPHRVKLVRAGFKPYEGAVKVSAKSDRIVVELKR